MEAAPRLPMVSFELKISTENVSFGPKLKQYIGSFYHEDPESYNNEIHNLESLRSSAVRPAIDVTGCQILKQYYCQMKFLKSRFPMEKGQTSAVPFSWKDLYSGISYTLPDINFELNCVLHNIGALHSQLGAADSRSSSEGMKMSCTHFQCAAWAFQHLRENYTQMVTVALLPDVIHFMQQLCLAQAQECILEKSMMDNRKSTIIAKVAVQVVDYYNSAMQILTSGNEYSTLADVVGSRVLKEWNRYLKFKIAYHNCISLLYQGQQAEEAQKMGERVAYYQAASEQLEEARKIAKGNMGQQQHEVDEALAFTQDVVEGKKKAAKNENEFIYHEVVPEKDALQQVNGASLVKGTPFNVNDPEVSGKDLFSRLVPMEAHEASSVYSEQKAEMLRQIGAIVDIKDSELVEFMSSLQLESLTQWRQANGVPQDIVDRAAAICAKPQATQALVEVMGRLAGTCHEVESVLTDIQELIKEEEAKEQEYQKIMGNRPPSIVSTDLSREAGKYSEAHSKANESNQTLHRAMMMHMSNLKVLAQPLLELKKAIPCGVPGDPSIDEGVISELETLVAKVDEMRAQRATLVSQLREAVCADDITALLVTKPPDVSMDQLFQKELTKHKRQGSLIEQNLSAQDNILSALTDVYAKFAGTRRYILDVLKRREATTSALIASYDAYDDLLAKANKGIEFYQKLEGNVTKLQQRVKSACRVNEEEREQMLSKSGANIPTSQLSNDSSTFPAPKLKDYLASMRASTATTDTASQWVPAVRPTPLGQEETNDKRLSFDSYGHYGPQVSQTETANIQYSYQQPVSGYYPTVQSTSLPSSATNLQQYSYADTNTYYCNSSKAETVPTGPTTSFSQNYSAPYYQTAEQSQSHQNYQHPASLQQNYQVPISYYPNNDLKSTQDQHAFYYPSSTMTMAANNQQNYQLSTVDTKSIQQYPQSYQYQQNYQMPSGYYQTPDSYTPSSTPQLNYSTPGIYSPSTDTNAPSQKLTQPEYQMPITCRSSSENYLPSNPYSVAAYQPIVEPSATVIKNSPEYPSSSNLHSAVIYQAVVEPTSVVARNTPSPEYSSSSNPYSASIYQPVVQQSPIVTVASNPASSGYSSNYNYPTNYQTSVDVSATYNGQYSQQQYQAPTEEYQKQYQYIPQYYPTSNYQQIQQQNGQQQQQEQQQPEQQQQHQQQQQPTEINTNNLSNYDSQYESSHLNQNNYYSSPYGYQTIGSNSMTMIHANNSVTSSRSTASTSSSNVDLLTGIDFSISQTPLQPVNIPIMSHIEQKFEEKPEQKSKTKMEPSVETSIKVLEKPVVKEKEKEISEKLVHELSSMQDPLLDPEIFNTFSQEVEKLEKFVDGLTTKTLNGPTALDTKWKEIQEQQDRDAQKSSISVARCYPMKNRFSDIMPYDHSRVELPSTKDDYINASHVKGIISLHAPPFIVTQTPLKSTFDDFWTMVFEQQIEVIICLLGVTEMEQEAAVYWPTERGSDLQIGRFRLVLQGVNNRDHWIERIISVGDGNKHLVVVHLQFTGWPGGGLFPTTVSPLISFANAVLACHRQQRIKNRPVLIHCLSGVGRSGVLSVLIAAMCDPLQTLDVAAAASRMSQSRKNVMRDREHLKFAYEAVLQHAKDLLSGKQLQAKMQNLNIAVEESNRLFSATSDALIDPTKSRKKFTPETFGALKEQGIAPVTDSNDPLSALDPLWTIRK